MSYRLNPFSGQFDEVSDISSLVTGPASATDNAITRFDGITGKLVQNSLASLNDSGQITLGADGSSALHAVTKQQMDFADGLLIPLTQKGAALGVATLDAGGKVPVSQLPNSIMEFKGVWNASTNTPTLSDATGNAGDVYIVSVAGTQDLGSGNITFAAGDWAVHDGSIWQKSINSNAVVSVNGYTGVVSLSTSDIAEGTNLYFSDERAQDAVGAMVTNSAKVSLTYVDGTPSLTADIVAGSLVNADISASAAIAYSKLNLTSSIVNADVSNSAAIAYSKLNLTSSIVNADVSNSAAIAYSKLNLASSIVDADVSASAAIARSKLAVGTANRLVSNDGTGAMSDLAAITANRALASNASGLPVASTVTDTELGYVSGVTSSIQTQLNAKIGSRNVANSRQTGLSVSASTVISPAIVVDGVQFVVGNGGPVVVTATAPVDNTGITIGQVLTIIGTDDVNTVTYNTGNNLTLNGTITLGKDDSVTIMYVGTDGTNTAWTELSRSI